MTAPITSSPAATTPPATSGASQFGGTLGKNEFLKLLTTQMRYQDPMNPMDGSKMAADLAQFSGLEQLVNINESLATQKTEFNTMVQALNNAVAINTIGKTVIAQGDQVAVSADANGVMTGRVMADIPTGGQATLKVLDAAGKEIASRPLGFVAAGDKKEFDLGSAATGLKEGSYTYRIEMTDASGKTVPQTTYTVGRVDGISYDANGAVLTAGPLSISISKIVKILS
jgi:flagellar basal-body rod modification protein FlgD